jgi:hypothetical protein
MAALVDVGERSRGMATANARIAPSVNVPSQIL